ncbi:MAG: hypothetical protein ACFN4K_06320, partial [Pauljensenia sp.]
TAASNTYADPHSDSETSPTTSREHSSKPEDSNPNYTLNYEEPRIWPVAPRSIVMRSDVDGVHFSQVDYCEVPHILAFVSLLHAGPTIHDGPPYIPTDFVAAIRALDVQGAQEALNNLVTYGPAESLFSQDCISGRWSVVTCVREQIRRRQWRTGQHVDCFVTGHMHAQIHAPLDDKALARMPSHPVLDAPPRAAIWAMMMGLIGG